jgi:hypothetical protein
VIGDPSLPPPPHAAPGRAAYPLTLGGDLKGITVLSRSGNGIRAEVTETDFLLSVTGFDENRDLLVKVTVPQEESDGLFRG